MRTIFIAAVLFALPAVALAQPRSATPLEEAPVERSDDTLQQADGAARTFHNRRDGQEEKYMEIVCTDGRLSGVQVINMISGEDPEAPAEAFVQRADLDGDGYLDADELAAAGFDVSGDPAETMTISATIDIVYENAGQ